MDFALGAEARIDAHKKHERGKFADLAAKAKEEVKEDGQQDGGQEPGDHGMGEKEGHVKEK